MLKRRPSLRRIRGSRFAAVLISLLAAGAAGTKGALADGDQSFPASTPAPPVYSSAQAPLPIGVDYRIHPGDVLSVQVYGEPSLTQTTAVLPDGSISYPLAGRIPVGGLSTEAASTRISESLGRFVRRPSVTVTVSSAAQYTVLVLGNVKNPGKYNLRSDARVTDAIAAAGGLGPTNGDLPVARVNEPHQGEQRVSLQRLFRQGDERSNLPLGDGAEVYVTSPVTFDVEVVGAVDHPGNVTLSEGDHLSMAIARAGNSSNSSADLNNIRVTRQLTDGKTTVYTVNLYQTLEHGNMGVDIPMKKGDVVYVPQVKRHGLAGGAGASAVFLLQHLAGFPYY